MTFRSRGRRWVRGIFRWSLTLLFALIVFALIDGWTAFGKRADGLRRARMESSRQWAEGQFRNPEPLHNDTWKMFAGFADASDQGSPTEPPPTVTGDRARFAQPPPTGLRITWFGHSSVLVEIDGYRILTDPVWSERISPVRMVGPVRWYPAPVPLQDLLPLDAVLISHDHYDHLDYPTIASMQRIDTRFIVPLGVGAHLAYWGIAEERITELDWWDRATVGKLEIACTPSRHASGRTMIDTDETLWAGYALLGPKHRVYFSGDTGLFPAMHDIGERLGPFDVTMIEVGAYGNAWPDWHLGPEQAVLAHRMVRGKVMLPIHWGLFNLAYHAWTEPVERTLAAAQESGVEVALPKPGESFEPAVSRPSARWWPDVPWKTAEQDPIVATRMPPGSLEVPRTDVSPTSQPAQASPPAAASP